MTEIDGPEIRPLLDQLGRGDEEAAGRAFREYEPYLRMVVRRRLTPKLRAKFDSVDIVQSVWADVLDHFRDDGRRFDDPSYLRNFLVRATLNRFVDRIRSNRRGIQHERPIAADQAGFLAESRVPAPSEVVQAEDLWRRMLALCPPEHREWLRLKRQGMPTAEIAAKTGLNPGSVRRILAQIASRLAIEEGRGTP